MRPRLPTATTVVVAALLVTVTTALLATFGAGYVARRREQREALRQQAALEADQLAVSLSLPVWNIDRAQIDRIVEGMAATPAVQALEVVAAGRVHARVRDADWRWVSPVGRQTIDGPFVEERTITFSGEPIGTLRLLLSPRFITQGLRRWLVTLVAAIVATDVLLVLGVYFVLWRTVLQPLLAIERYAVAVTAGDAPAALAPCPTEELETLRASIETMVRLQQSLRHSEKMSAMGTLVAGVAHEVRTPLFGISATLDAYDEELRAGDLAECSRALRQHVNRLTHLMAELLEYGKPAAIQVELGSLREVVDEVLAGRASSSHDAQVALENSVPAGLPALRMDRRRLRQVFENLVDNALQHSPRSAAVKVSAGLVQQDGQAWIECEVDDQGGGFASDDLPRVFEPFFTRRKGGTGLGLSIVQRIVEQHGGRVSVSNRSGGGARVTVRLPVPAPGGSSAA
jgi:signal transduction histidine kinase